MLLAIDRRLSPEQRATAAARFRRFAQEFQLLAKAGGGESRAQ